MNALVGTDIMKTDTPRTDGVARKWIREQKMVPDSKQAVCLLIKTFLDHARVLERELNDAQKELKMWSDIATKNTRRMHRAEGDSSNAPRQPRRDSGVGLDAVVGLLPVGLIPIPPMILQEANRRAMERGDLTFGHGIALGLALCATWGLCAAAIWIKRAIVHRFRKANAGGEA